MGTLSLENRIAACGVTAGERKNMEYFVLVGNDFYNGMKTIFKGSLEDCRKVLNKFYSAYAFAYIEDEAGSIFL